MSVTVVGSVAFDAIETPFGKRERILGGAGTHFALAASFFTDVHLVGVVGHDFGDEQVEIFETRGIDLDDLERVDGERSFFWAGRYGADLNVAETLDTQLNVFARFNPTLSRSAREAPVLFLANIQPDVQRRVREQCNGAVLAGLDSMNYWIESERASLVQTIRSVDALALNDAEMRLLTGEPNIARAVKQVTALGPRVVIVKCGSYGACLFSEDEFFFVPGYPLENVVDPTGAGDAFAGGFFGYLSSRADHGESISADEFRCAAVCGSVLASFVVEGFGSERVYELTAPEIASRFKEFRRMTTFEAQPTLIGA